MENNESTITSAAASTDTSIGGETGVEQKAETTKTYTQEEVNALLQQETDRRVTSALKKQQEKFNQEKSEAEKLAQMNDEQKRQYEYEKKVAELEKREKDFNIMQNKVSASKIMVEKGLPIAFVDYIVAEDADTMMSNITTFETQWKAAIADAVSARIASKSPNSGSVSQTGLSSEGFKKMSVAQQAELYRTNPELYKQLSGMT